MFSTKKSYGDNPENPVIIGENVGISASGSTLVVKEFSCNEVINIIKWQIKYYIVIYWDII